MKSCLGLYLKKNYISCTNFILLKTLLLFLLPLALIAQNDIPFKNHKKTYVKGNSLILGNTILGKHKTKPFNDEKASNDEVYMKYVDIDDDETTFSSSASEIIIPETANKIAYAGLYWSALYPAKKTTMLRTPTKVKYNHKGERESNFNSILIKAANQSYTSIEGVIVFDAKDEKSFKDDSPYICRADLTTYFNNLEKPNGLFTVANIKAVQGMPKGGSAGGWFLYIIYEDNTQTPKYFTLFDGFQQVNKKGLEITFKDFQTKYDGIISSNLVMATLEGDHKIKSDNCSVYNTSSQNYIPLNAPNRSAKNFFKSIITTKGERVPSSINTLGFDLIKTKLPEGTISNNSNETKIKFGTKADRFYLLFTAFETEIDETFFREKITPVATINKIDVKNNQQSIKDSVLEEIKETKILISEEKQNVVESNNEDISTNTTSQNIDEEEIKKYTIDGIETGYYLITNVFSNTYLAEKWTNKLIKLGHTPKSFVNPKNNWTYIYIEKSKILSEIKVSESKLRVKELFKKAWVIGINL